MTNTESADANDTADPGDNDPRIDPRFDEAEADVAREEPWLFREQDAPNPLTIEATGWSTGVTKFGEAEFLAGVDRAGKTWSILVGAVLLKKRLIEGLVEEWDNGRNAFVVVRTEGRVQPGEVLSIKYLGDKKGAVYDYPNFNVSRKPVESRTPGSGNYPEITSEKKDPAPANPAPAEAEAAAEAAQALTKDEIPF